MDGQGGKPCPHRSKATHAPNVWAWVPSGHLFSSTTVSLEAQWSCVNYKVSYRKQSRVLRSFHAVLWGLYSMQLSR
jgi:hypothetical protein